MSSLVIVDLGMGNLASVIFALRRAANASGHSAPVLSRDPDVIAGATHLFLPGQGAFRDAAHALAADNHALAQAVRHAIARGNHYFGICLGLQLLFPTSDEAPGLAGLGLLPGHVTALAEGQPDPQAEGRTLKIPHMGWNALEIEDTLAGAIVAAFVDDLSFYFVHSFHAVTSDASIVGATVTHGTKVTAAVARDNVFATQFHPEKSQRAGQVLLERFLAR